MEIDIGKRKKLRRKVTVICGAFVLILSVTLGLLGVYTYEESVRKRYEQYAETIIRMAICYIDVEDMEECIQTREKSDIYQQTQLYLDTIKECADIEYLYVILPRKEESIDDNSMYIWSAMTEEDKKDSEEDGTLGDPLEEDFRVKMAEAFTAAMTGGYKVSFANDTEDFGHMLTGMHPLQNTDGHAVALVCADISMNQIYQDIYRYIWFMLCGTLVVGAIFLFVILRLMDKSMASLLPQVSQSTADPVQQSSTEADQSGQADRR